MKDPSPSEISAVLAVERPYLPDYDVPLETHPSHSWSRVSDRWRECDRCGTRDHWPRAEVRCIKIKSPRSSIDETQAWNAIVSDLERFFVWWAKRKDTPDTLRSVNEWAANFFEWRKK